jgi:membrane-associated phospholipid phosphatase
VRSTRRIWLGVALSLVPAATASAEASAQAVTASDAAPAADSARERLPATELKLARELALLGIGAGLQTAFRVMPRPSQPVPPPGLDPSTIALAIDRDVVGTGSASADDASDWARDASVAFALGMMAATAGRQDPIPELARRGLVYVETALISHGLTYLAKRALGRPRPFAYRPESDRPSGSAYDVTKGGAFESMPSGHASSAWTAATLGMTEHLLSRPAASGLERVGVGLIGGGLAGATSALRVAAGQHFPTDVMLSAGIGLLTGVTIPLLHRGERPMPTRRAWLEMSGGAAAGVLVGVVAAMGY